MHTGPRAFGRLHALVGGVSSHLVVAADGTLHWRATPATRQAGDIAVAHLLVIDIDTGRLHGELHEAGALPLEPPATLLRGWAHKPLPGLFAGAPECVAVHPGLTDDAHTWMDLEVIAAELGVQRNRWDSAQAFVDAELGRWEKAAREFLRWAERLQGGALLLGQAQKLCAAVSLALCAHPPRLADLPREHRSIDLSHPVPHGWSAGLGEALAPAWRGGAWRAFFTGRAPQPIDWRITPSPYAASGEDIAVL
jgi:hypothetical protein